MLLSLQTLGIKPYVCRLFVYRKIFRGYNKHDNSACEGFFGRLKNEMFYGRNWNHASIDSFIHKLDEYIHWYNETRIKISLGGMSPFQYRRSLGIAI